MRPARAFSGGASPSPTRGSSGRVRPTCPGGWSTRAGSTERVSRTSVWKGRVGAGANEAPRRSGPDQDASALVESMRSSIELVSAGDEPRHALAPSPVRGERAEYEMTITSADTFET